MAETDNTRTCGEYRYRIAEDGSVIMRYLGPVPQKVQRLDEGKDVAVPAQLDDLPVTGIMYDAFRESGVVRVFLPDGVRRIGSGAFAFCRSLREIRLPDSLLEIGEEAFRGCICLNTVQIPKNVREITSRMFMGCSALSSAGLPEELEVIGPEAFRDCSALEKLLPARLPLLHEIGKGAFRGCAVLQEIRLGKDAAIGIKAFRGCGQLTVAVPEGSPAEAYCRDNLLRYKTTDAEGITVSVNEPPPPAEYEYEEIRPGIIRLTRCVSRSERLAVPEKIDGKTVTEIGSMVFRDYGKLRSVILPDSVTVIGKAAFVNRSFREITVGKNLREIDDEAFSGCLALKTVRGLGPALRRIGAGAFRECMYLRSFDFPTGNLEIGEKAFQGCTALKSVTVPDGALSVGPSAFSGCTRLESVRLPAGTAAIGAKAFEDCYCLKTIDIPSASATIGPSAFASCVHLAEIRLADHRYLSVVNGVLTDRKESRAIAYCAGAEEKGCVIPGNVGIIGTNAFANAKIERLIIPEGVRVIENHAFASCHSLRAVQLPGTLRVIGRSAFSCCYALLWLAVPEGVEEIGGWAFYNCVNMNRLRLPSSLKRIDPDLFGFGRPQVCIVPKGSYAEQYCLENGYRFEYE